MRLRILENQNNMLFVRCGSILFGQIDIVWVDRYCLGRSILFWQIDIVWADRYCLGRSILFGQIDIVWAD